MRIPKLLVALIVASPISAQSITYDFESSGQPDISGWSMACGELQTSTDVPPGGGMYSLSVPAFDPQDPCGPLIENTAIHLWPDAVVGNIYTLSAWIKNQQ